jgi:hypothetical protein
VSNGERLGIIAVVVVVLVLLLAPRARANAGIQVIGEPGVENHFPDSLVFSIEAQSDTEIRDVRFRYRFIPDNLSSSAQADFQPGAHVRATFTLRSGTRQVYIPPGKTIRYTWQLTDAGGNTTQTEERETSFADTRFQWQSVTDGTVQLNYYRGTQRDAEVMAQVANETITKAAALMGARIDFPVKIWAYASQADFQIALAHSSVTNDPNVLGQAHDPDTFIMVVDRLSSPTALDTARHELTHLVTADALTGGPFKDLYPAWLNEGTSVYNQVSPNDVGYIDALDEAIRTDTLIPIKSLVSGGKVQDIGLFYGESYALVKFMVETYGADKFAQMIDTFKKSGDLDQTFKTVYGVDREGLYRAYRKSVGLAEEPKQPQDTTGAAPKASGGNGATIALIAGGAVLLVLLTGGAVAGGLLLARRAQRGDVE